jgi:tetratricopeptide (TPR) repeat protein
MRQFDRRGEMPLFARPPVGAATFTLPQAIERAFVAYQRGELVEAEKLCRAILKARTDCFEALHLLGIITARTRRAPEAVELLKRAIASNPRDAAVHSHLGNVFRGLNRPAEALQSYDRALALEPGYAEAHYSRGNALGDLKRPAEALESYERALALMPDLAEAHNNRGIALNALNRGAEALQSYERALVLKPDYAEAYNNRGIALFELKRPADALESHDRALALKPDYAQAHYGRGVALSALSRLGEALESYERALALEPGHAEALNDRGIALFELRRHAEAIDSYERALALKPDYASAHWNLALCRLLLGHFALGWQDYEWRLKAGQQADQGRKFVQPLWLGAQTLEGKTILLHSEQGLGDTLQFCRYVREVAALGAKVLLEVQPPLGQLLADLDGAAQVLTEGSPLPAFDYQCPLPSLPLAFKTDLHNIPSRTPYIRSDAARVATWQKRLGIRTKPRVGLVWSGSAAHSNDRNRSIALAEILPPVSSWAEWISLQKDVRESDAALLASRADVRHLGSELEDFADTAALVELMDLVVTVDTSVAHLAGAMGKAVWILLPFNPDWRWLLDREDSVWYPAARLFRQPAIGDWASAIRCFREELERRFRSPGD